MKQVAGIWLPDDDNHFESHLKKGPQFEGAGTYQMKKIQATLQYVRPNPRRAIDVGAHVGLWSRVLARTFPLIDAFEPMPELAQCFVKNLVAPGKCEIDLHTIALGHMDGFVAMKRAVDNTGNACVQEKGEFVVTMRRLDAYEFDDVDLIKVDCEGYEEHVIVGAYETIVKCRPAIIVEQKPGNAERYGLQQTGAVVLLKKMGAMLHQEIAGDFIMSWPDK